MRVIAIAYGHVPLDRVATGETDNLVYVAAPSAANAPAARQFAGVGFPRNSVYPFDSRLFDSLTAVAGDERAIRALLQTVEPLTSGCLSSADLLRDAA